MAYSYETFTISDAGDATYTFTKSYRVQSTLVVSLRTPPGDYATLVKDTDYTLSGTEGSLVVTLIGATFSGLQIGDILKVERVEPLAKSDRAVVFQDGSLSSDDLNAAMEQTLNGVQQISDKVDETMTLDIETQTSYDADGKRLINLATPTEDNDACTKGYVDDVVLDTGNLPTAIGQPDDYLLTTLSDRWVFTDGAAFVTNNASPYFLSIAENLGDVESVPDCRTNLGLGTAALEDVGTLEGDVPVLAANGLINSTQLPVGTVTDWVSFRILNSVYNGQQHGSSTLESFDNAYTPPAPMDTMGSTTQHKMRIPATYVNSKQGASAPITVWYSGSGAGVWDENTVELDAGTYRVRADISIGNRDNNTTNRCYLRIWSFDTGTGDNSTNKFLSLAPLLPVAASAPTGVVATDTGYATVVPLTIETVITSTGSQSISFDLMPVSNTTQGVWSLDGFVRIEKLNA